MNKSRMLWLGLVLGLGALTAFQQRKLPEEVQQLVDKAIIERVEKIRQNRVKQCRRKAMERANEIVDSLLILSVKAIKEDSIVRPEKPVKPEMPVVEVPQDTSPIAPLLPMDSSDTSN
ncbi:MAG: hypothetical protein AAGG75_08300 [Bacteroidota bacterium]